LRNFAAHVSATDADWFERPIQDIPIPEHLEFGATADGAAPVDLPDGSKAFIKPRDHAAPSLMVAREKICADLGQMLGFPTAPAVVRRPSPETGWVSPSLLSLVALPSARPWQFGGAEHTAVLAHELECLRVFWTWVGDEDHNAHPQNLLFEAGDHPKVLSIDHSFTLCHGNAANPLAVGVCAGYGSGDIAGSDLARRAAVDGICSKPQEEIERVVRRLDEILSVGDQDRIISILTTRRGNLPAWFGL
jgi:hypothetical protein